MLPICFKVSLLFVCFTWIEALANYKCDNNEYFNYKDGCDPTCDDSDGSCFNKNSYGCHCLPGYVRSKDRCVKPEECPELIIDNTSNPDNSDNIDPNNPKTIKLVKKVFGTPEDWYAEQNKAHVEPEYPPTPRRDAEKILSEPKDSGYVDDQTDLDLDDPETQKILEQIFGPNGSSVNEKRQDEVDPNDPKLKKVIEDIFGTPPTDSDKVNYRMEPDASQN